MTLSVYGLTPIPFSDKTNIYEFVYIYIWKSVYLKYCFIMLGIKGNSDDCN